jgi:hypothetical protein
MVSVSILTKTLVPKPKKAFQSPSVAISDESQRSLLSSHAPADMEGFLAVIPPTNRGGGGRRRGVTPCGAENYGGTAVVSGFSTAKADIGV